MFEEDLLDQWLNFGYYHNKTKIIWKIKTALTGNTNEFGIQIAKRTLVVPSCFVTESVDYCTRAREVDNS